MAAVIMNTWTLLLNNFACKLLPVFPRRLGCFVHFRYIADLPIDSWINFTGITRVMFIFILSYLLNGWGQILKGIFPIEHCQFLKIEITFRVFVVSQIPIRAVEKQQQQIIDVTPFERFVKRERHWKERRILWFPLANCRWPSERSVIFNGILKSCWLSEAEGGSWKSDGVQPSRFRFGESRGKYLLLSQALVPCTICTSMYCYDTVLVLSSSHVPFLGINIGLKYVHVNCFTNLYKCLEYFGNTIRKCLNESN